MKEAAAAHFESMKQFHAQGLINRPMSEIKTELHKMHQLDRLVLFAFPLSGSVQQSGPAGYQRDAIQLQAIHFPTFINTGRKFFTKIGRIGHI